MDNCPSQLPLNSIVPLSWAFALFFTMLCEAAVAAIAKDDVQALAEALQLHSLSFSEFYVSPGIPQGPRRDLLSLAAAAGACSCVSALLAAGAQPNAQSPSDGFSPLHSACSSANSSTARVIALLVRGGADKTLLNHAGLTACDLLSLETSQVGL